MMTSCGPIEWGAISVACGILAFAGGYFAGATAFKKRVEGVELRVTKIETEQASCQKQLAARLLKGDRSFEEINRQVASLARTAESLMGVTENLQNVVEKIEQRLWDGHERRGG